ncbi:hypothetical protein D9M70_639190 [compost metagenome]
MCVEIHLFNAALLLQSHLDKINQARYGSQLAIAGTIHTYYDGFDFVQKLSGVLLSKDEEHPLN